MGYNGALSKRQKKGAQLFFGKANCSNCHVGRILSDQKPHNIGVPQLGPGKPPHEPYDLGAFRVTGNEKDKFAFKTPSLHNVAITGPWMHNGAYKSLEGAVRHHLNPEKSLRNYNKQQLGRDIQKYHRSPNWEHQLDQFPMGPPGTQLIPTVKDDPESIDRVLSTLDPQVQAIPELSDREVDQIMYFLFSLTSPTYVMEEYKDQNGKDQNLTQPKRMKTSRTNLYNRSTVPDTTPSGLPPECKEDWCMKDRGPEQ
jgi:cytochrome c peroxidase